MQDTYVTINIRWLKGQKMLQTVRLRWGQCKTQDNPMQNGP